LRASRIWRAFGSRRFRRFARDDDARGQRARIGVARALDRHANIVDVLLFRHVLQMRDQIELRATGFAQAEGSPAQPDNIIGALRLLHARNETAQGFRRRITAIGDAYFAFDAGAAVERLAAMFVGGKDWLGRISKKGNTYIRRLLVTSATSMLRYARAMKAAGADWVKGLLQRRPAWLVTVAMANKTARIAWAVMMKGETFEFRPAA
jgi:transposase